MTVTDQLLENNEKYAANFDGPLPLRRGYGAAQRGRLTRQAVADEFGPPVRSHHA